MAERIAAEAGLERGYVLAVARSASHRYKKYHIPKRSGGVRLIYHPARELKLLQYWLLRNVLDRLPVHPAAFAYREGVSISALARMHLRQNFLLRADFENFFPSIRGADVVAVLRSASGGAGSLVLESADYEFVRRVVCREDRLTIGAPTSPALCNAVMFELDARWSDAAKAARAVYSRYADDLYFSTDEPDTLAGILAGVREDLRQRATPSLRINEAKTVFSSRKRRRLVTGLVLSSQGRVSLGRAKKRRIRALLFRHSLGQASPTDVAYLRGFIAYALSVEPAFVETLRRRYGSAVTSVTSGPAGLGHGQTPGEGL